jgi:histone-lysine N-methyltransferase SETMAR
LLSKHRRFDWLDSFVTGDEKWVLYVNIERKRQWLKPGQKPLPVPKPGLHPQKRMLSVWWDVQGVLYFEVLPEKHTITGRSYADQLQRLANQIEIKRPRHGKIYFQHDNARPHTAKVVEKKLETLGWEKVTHPPYSTDLAPSDYHLFRSLQHDLKKQQFNNEDALKTYLHRFFDSKTKEFYSRGIRDLPRRWREVVKSNGEYII